MAKKDGNMKVSYQAGAMAEQKKKMGMNMENRQMNMNSYENHRAASTGNHPGKKARIRYSLRRRDTF